MMLVTAMLMITGCQKPLEKPAVDVMQTQPDQSNPTQTDGFLPEPIPQQTEPPAPEEVPALPKAEDPLTLDEPEMIPEPEQTPVVGLSNAKKSWYFNRNAEHEPPTAQRDINIGAYNAYYLGDTSEKVLYLTFDEGYENGFTSTILDILKEKQVKAAFFLTKPYIKSEPDLVRRMVDEGHIAGNHSVTHKSFPDLTDEQVASELQDTADFFKEITAQDMPRYLRPPMGEYSEHALALADSLGYKTIFWSFAYQDWLTDQQPGKDAAYQTVMDNLHNGAILLLHAVSESNTQALPDIIDAAMTQGYTFKTLDDIPQK